MGCERCALAMWSSLQQNYAAVFKPLKPLISRELAVFLLHGRVFSQGVFRGCSRFYEHGVFRVFRGVFTVRGVHPLCSYLPRFLSIKNSVTIFLCSRIWSGMNPADFRLPLFICAIRQIQIDQCLVRKAGLFRQILEILNCALFQIDCNLLFYFISIRVLPCVGKIIFFLHCRSYLILHDIVGFHFSCVRGCGYRRMA